MDECLRGYLLAALLALLVVAAATPGVHAQGAPEAKGPVILTVAGEISKTNRGPFNEARDSFFKFHEITFDRALELDRAMLDKLKQGTVKVNAPQTDGPVVLKGALLSDLLEFLGVPEGASIRTVALDGFGTEISTEQIKANDWTLVVSQNGRPLGIGGQGPVWMVYTPSKVDAPEEEEQQWPWALFYIEVKK